MSEPLSLFLLWLFVTALCVACDVRFKRIEEMVEDIASERERRAGK